MTTFNIHGIYRDLLALLSGFLLTMAFAPFEYSYLAPLALVILFASWINASPTRALLRGYLFGLGSFGLGISWVYISIHDFGGVPIVESVLITVLCVTFWALFPAIAGWLSIKTLGQSNAFVTPVVWILIEYLRGYLFLNGFPWLLVAYSQLDTPLAGYIPILGVYGTGFIIAITASFGLHVLFRQKRWRLAMVFIAVLWLAGYGLQQKKWTFPIGGAIDVVLIQGNITQDQKWQPENRLNTLLSYKKMTEDNWGADVIVWPETAIPAFYSQVNEVFLKPLKQAAIAHHTDLIVSLPMEGKKEDEIYNAVITLGKSTGIYRKDHLLPFGEYMPLQPFSGWVLKNLNIGLGDFTAGGKHQPLLTAGGHPFMTSICYEDAFGDAAIGNLPEAAYLVNVTNDGWFGNSLEPYQHLQVARMRALETGRYMLRATNTGATAVIAPNGTITASAPLFNTTTLSAKIVPMGGRTPYVVLGDIPVIVMLTSFYLLLKAYKSKKIRRLFTAIIPI